MGMKRLIILFLALFPLSVVAQNSDFSQLVKRYSKERGFTIVQLSRQLLDTMGVEDGIESMSAISADDTPMLQEFCEDAQDMVANLYNVMSFINEGKDVKIYSNRKASNGKITLLVIFIRSDNAATFISLTGQNIELEKALPKVVGKGNGA